MGVGRADGGLDGGVGHCAVEGCVSGTAEEHPGRMHNGQLPGVRRVKGPQVLAVAHFPVPGLAEGVGLPVEVAQ